ncbi:VirB4 family type IV secretion system protein [Thalassospira marina]|uniref:Type IV secretion system protein VirB4 n=1 Tax=Thalassospira marina TaxID=2048283 RepID=A0ABM6QH29_9PROT|nr:VirB4 family type IV secretion system protein [Thalassospira marina]AUG55911.1 type IV secretion system protein VirB4 [Thalassospira marina]
MIWPSVLATSLVATMAGSLAVPASRRLLLGDVKYDWLQDQLELDCIESDAATIRGKDNSLSRVFRFIGTSYDAKIEAEQENLLQARSILVHKLGQLGLSLRWFGIKRKRAINARATWPNAPLQEVGDAEAKQFRSSYFIDWYLVITGTAMPALNEATDIIDADGAKYGVGLLAKAPDGQNCELTGFLNGVVCGEYRDDLAPIPHDISGGLPASDLNFHKDNGVIQSFTPTEKLQKVITVAKWPGTVTGQIINDIMNLDGEIEICQVCDPFDQHKALLYLTRRLSGEQSALFGNAEAAAETDALIAMINQGDATLFATLFLIIARADNTVKLDNLLRKITRKLSNHQTLYHVQVRGAPVCWFNRIPARSKAKLIPGGRFMSSLELRSENIAALWAMQHSATGQTESPLGPAPLRWFTTTSGQAYAANFHVFNKAKTLANFLVFAPAGSGKSTLLMHLLSGAAKFDRIRSFILDSKEGSRFMVEALGGLYQSYEKLSLNPLDVGEDNPGNRERINFILKAMAGIDLAPDDQEALSHAIDLAFQIDPPNRTLNALYPYAFAKRSELRRAFSQWVTDDKGNAGLRSHIMNAPHDSLGGMLNQSHMVGINMNEALKDPSLGAPIVGHIAETIAKSVAPNLRGFIILIEEAANLLRNPGFCELAAEMYREYRKLNGIVGMIFQDPAALVKSGKAEAFIENTAVFIFFPNSKIDDESLEPFNLNDEQKAFVKGRTRSDEFNDRRVLIIKRDEVSGYEESAILNVDLSPLGDPLRFYRSGPDENKLMEQLQKQWGDAWRNHL